jgi:negative regulator of replication initiation
MNVLGPHVKWLIFLFDFNQDLVFSTDFRKKNRAVKIFVEILPPLSVLFNTDGQTGKHDEANNSLS